MYFHVFNGRKTAIVVFMSCPWSLMSWSCCSREIPWLCCTRARVVTVSRDHVVVAMPCSCSFSCRVCRAHGTLSHTHELVLTAHYHTPPYTTTTTTTTITCTHTTHTVSVITVFSVIIILTFLILTAQFSLNVLIHQDHLKKNNAKTKTQNRSHTEKKRRTNKKTFKKTQGHKRSSVWFCNIISGCSCFAIFGYYL